MDRLRVSRLKQRSSESVKNYGSGSLVIGQAGENIERKHTRG